jgi:xanthine/CO dehydrogenase XdhC/CoxF family maturation factor
MMVSLQGCTKLLFSGLRPGRRNMLACCSGNVSVFFEPFVVARRRVWHCLDETCVRILRHHDEEARAGRHIVWIADQVDLWVLGEAGPPSTPRNAHEASASKWTSRHSMAEQGRAQSQGAWARKWECIRPGVGCICQEDLQESKARGEEGALERN